MSIDPISKKRARESFNRAATTYDNVAVLQREVGKRLIERLDIIKAVPQSILDVGCGTGDNTLALSKIYKRANIVALDFADQMLKVANNKRPWSQRLLNSSISYVCADAENLPFNDNSFDFIFSNLTLQWCIDLDRTFSEFKRILKPEGLVFFSTLGPDTLKELRHSWRQVDSNQHVHTFIDMHDVGDAMIRAGLADPVMDVEHFTLTYDSTINLMRELKQLGAHNASVNRPHQLTGKNHLRAVQQHYETYRIDNKLPATYEVVYGHAWSVNAQKSAPGLPNSVNVQFKPKKI